jgi:hypothetical protein
MCGAISKKMVRQMKDILNIDKPAFQYKVIQILYFSSNGWIELLRIMENYDGI